MTIIDAFIALNFWAVLGGLVVRLGCGFFTLKIMHCNWRWVLLLLLYLSRLPFQLFSFFSWNFSNIMINHLHLCCQKYHHLSTAHLLCQWRWRRLLWLLFAWRSCCIHNRLEYSDWIWRSFGWLTLFRTTKYNKNWIARCFYHNNSHVTFILKVPTPINNIWRAIKYSK